ncbi:hypothetical protein Ancab_012433 [Ancistrocladus abbreviatus]
MGDKMENEHITIPMATYESSSQPLRTSENVNPEIVHHDTSQLTPSGDASSVAEPPPPSGNAPPLEGAASKDEKWTPTYTCLVAVMCVLCIILFPLCLLCAMGAFLFCNKDLTEEKPDEHAEDEGTKQSIYLKVQEFRGTAFHIAKMVSVIHSRIMIGLLTWLIINLSIKSLRRKIILGSHLWQWTLVVVVTSCGYPVINMLMTLTLHYFTKMYKNRKDVVYFVRGLRKSFNLIIFSTVLLLTWHFLLPFLQRAQPCSTAQPSPLPPPRVQTSTAEIHPPTQSPPTSPPFVLRPHHPNATTLEVPHLLKSYCCHQRPHRWELASAIQSFHRKTSSAHLLFHIVRWTLVSLVILSICWLFKNTLLLKWEADAIYNRFSNRIRRAGFQLYITEDNLRKFLKVDEEKAKEDEEEAKLLYAELQGGHPSAQVSYETFEKWMMEVKRISILTTTFLKTSGGEEVIYPNSILGTKTIVNLKGEPDPNDYIELNLHPTTKQSKILKLREKIKKFLNGGHAAQDDDAYCRIVVKEIGNVIKMGVHFKHVMTILDVTHSQCLETKNKQRSKHLLKIKKFLEVLEIKTV